MMRQKIDYGIDLGTTNSAIARIERGEAVILKSDDNQMDTTPSCVAYKKNKRIFVGLSAKNQIENDATVSFQQRNASKANSYQEFKRTMGTDHQYPSSFMERAYSSEELSAEVLKKLRGYVRDETVDAVVITVPAMFRQNQLDATQQAAELSGFKYFELLQEPIAASIAYGIKANSSDGHWLVFDFGGGTFDAALMHVDEGIMKVIDTEGDNHLGGKNIDSAIVDELLIPALESIWDLQNTLSDAANKRLLQEALKRPAEEAKIALSSRPSYSASLEDLLDDSGDEMTEDIQISLKEYEDVCGPIFQKAIDICLSLLKRNGLSTEDLTSVILVGGPTFSQTLRRMVKEQITPRVDTSVDPMTAVAVGAALFASTRTVPTDVQKRDTTKAQLTLKYPETTVEPTENLGIRVDRAHSSKTLPPTLIVEVIRSDKAWSSGLIALEGDAEIIEVLLNEDRANQFEIKLSSKDGTQYPCEPNTITVIHGLKIANATLPRGVGLEVYNITTGTRGVFAIPGLKKNTTLPASGKDTYKTAKDLRPGKKTDKIVLSFFEFDYAGDGSRAIHNQPIGSITLTGEDLPAHLPAGSDIEVTVSFDASRKTKFSVFIPSLDETIEPQVERDIQLTESAESLLEDIEEARILIQKLEAIVPVDVIAEKSNQLDEMVQLLSNRSEDVHTTLDVRESLKKTFIAIEKLETDGHWPKVEAKLDSAMESLLVNDQRYGNDKSKLMVDEYQKLCIAAKVDKNEKVAKQLIDEMFSLSFTLMQEDIGLWMSWIKDYDQAFETIEWSDKKEARRILNQAKTMIATNPSRSRVEDAVRALWKLMPKSVKEADSRISDELLRRS